MKGMIILGAFLVIVGFLVAFIGIHDLGRKHGKENASVDTIIYTSEEYKSPIFCIKVATRKSEDYPYQIEFSNDNFDLDRHELYDLLDLAEIMNDPNKVFGDTRLFRHEDKAKAIEIAKNFDSYEKCIEHNKNIIERCNRLREHYAKSLPREIPKVIKQIPTETIVICEK